MSMRIFRVVAVLALLPAAAVAQGSLGTQGFGYSTGQLSTRALGAGGAMGEMDPLSATNPAVLSYFGGTVLYLQAEPEYRTLTSGANSEASSVARYPLVAAAFPVSSTWTLGLSASNFLDRTFRTQTRGTVTIADTTIGVTNQFQSDGAIADLRLALAWNPVRWLKLGAAAHAIAGDNRVRSSQHFDDSTRFAALLDTATIGYTGNALSAGAEVLLGTEVSLAGSYRRGGSLSLKRGDTTIAKAHVPDRLAFSASYIGIRGTALSVRTAHETWTRMADLGSSSLRVNDTWDTSVGADVLGPRFGEHAISLRTGMRWRTLPFGISTATVNEKTYSVGAGTLIGRGGRAALDLALLHANRTATALLSETAWTFSAGLTVRP